MIEKLVLVMILACPVMMGLMMLLMWRGMRGHRRPEEPFPRDSPRTAKPDARRT